MIPYFITAAITYLFIEALSEATDKSTTEFNKDDIITDCVKFFKSTEETKAKSHATKTINKLIKNTKGFKIGKSGTPKDRNIQHTQFEKMYIIVESKNKKFINKLEGIYNGKYISNKKNKNCKIGSAGEMTDKTGRYFLYFITA
jgi:hypothetical protein